MNQSYQDRVDDLHFKIQKKLWSDFIYAVMDLKSVFFSHVFYSVSDLAINLER